MRKMTLCLLLAALTLALLAGCGAEPAPTTEPTTEPPVLSITYTEGMALSELEQYPQLQSADLRGCTDYEGIQAYMEKHPEVKVTYEVKLGDQVYGNDTAELTFAADATPYEELLENMKYLPALTSLSLPETNLSAEQLSAIKERYPELTLDYTVRLFGTVYEAGVTAADLSMLTAEQIGEATAALSLLPQLQTVELMAADGSSPYALEDVKALQEALPGVFFNYSFEFFGQTLSTADERVEYDRVKMGDEYEAQIRLVLDVLTNCTYFKLDDCGMSYPLMAQLRDDYPDTKVVWRVHVDRFNMLTDETVLRLTHRLKDYNVHDLKYLTEAVYLDIGHNEELTDISFVQYMPNLECVIVSGAPVVDLSWFANCKKLIWMELCFCGWVRDISVFADHPTLKYLNISYTRVADLSPLDNVELERFNALHIPASQEQKNAYREKYPDCYTLYEGDQPYGYGWRYDPPNFTMHPYYANMRVVFRYGEAAYWGNHREN